MQLYSVLVADEQDNEQGYYKLACIVTYTFSFYTCAVEDLTRLSSHERLHAFPELSRDQIDTLLKVPALVCWMHCIKSQPRSQAFNHMEGLVKLLRRMMSGGCLEAWLSRQALHCSTVYRKCHASRRPPDVILRRSFTRASTALAVIEGLGTRLIKSSSMLYWSHSQASSIPEFEHTHGNDTTYMALYYVKSSSITPSCSYALRTLMSFQSCCRHGRYSSHCRRPLPGQVMTD